MRWNSEHSGQGHDWLDREAGPVVRPYAMTGGRVPPVAGGFDLVAFVVARPYDGPLPVHLQPEHRAILDATRHPMSVAEIAAHLDLALGVVRVLLGDLLAERLIAMHEPDDTAGLPDENILKAVVNGLRAL
ncbi:MAG TPA: DUF742 domain-containing protein [Micromonosporaceae bacterium]|nr:DUF742 domain-containing protein [Micromonosporaceae bacterium]